MGDIDSLCTIILAKAKYHDHHVTIIVSTLFLLKTNYKHVLKYRCKNGKLVMISDDYHKIGRLLLLTIIACR